VAAISYDSVPVLKNFAERKKIAIPLLSDADSKLIRQLGILNEAVPKNSPFFGVPHPVTYIVGADGTIRSKHFEEDYRRRLTVGTILGEPASQGQPFRNERVAVRTAASDGKVRGGERVRLFVTVDLRPKMHVYAPGVTGYIPLEWQMADGQPAEILPAQFPQSRTLHLPAINERVPVYENSVTLTRDVVIAPKHAGETLTLTGSLRVQACDDKKCYVPESIPLEWVFAYEPHDSTRVPPELRRLK
jgi:DsbC/DsbD-like thiol-disulfide interchange protein